MKWLQIVVTLAILASALAVNISLFFYIYVNLLFIKNPIIFRARADVVKHVDAVVINVDAVIIKHIWQLIAARAYKKYS